MADQKIEISADGLPFDHAMNMAFEAGAETKAYALVLTALSSDGPVDDVIDTEKLNLVQIIIYEHEQSHVRFAEKDNLAGIFRDKHNFRKERALWEM